MARLDCPPHLDIAAAPSVHDALVAALGAGPVELGLGSVCRLDAAGAQLLWAAHQAGVALAEPSEAVTSALECLGMAEILGRKDKR